MEAFPAQECSHLALFSTVLCFFEDRDFICGGELPPYGLLRYLRIADYLGCVIANFSSIIVISFPPSESQLLEGKRLVDTGTESRKSRSESLHTLVLVVYNDGEVTEND
jgi:hypothetical protein